MKSGRNAAKDEFGDYLIVANDDTMTSSSLFGILAAAYGVAQLFLLGLVAARAPTGRARAASRSAPGFALPRDIATPTCSLKAHPRLGERDAKRA